MTEDELIEHLRTEAQEAQDNSALWLSCQLLDQLIKARDTLEGANRHLTGKAFKAKVVEVCDRITGYVQAVAKMVEQADD